jgi:acetyl esterase/lipase
MEVDDVKTVTNWAISHAAPYNANPKNIFLLGQSSGGHLASMATEQLNTSGSKKIKAVISLSGAYDFVNLANHEKAGNLSYLLIQAGQIAFGCDLKVCATSTLQKWSPRQNLTTANCPGKTLLFASRDEFMPLDQVNDMAQTLTAKTCKVNKVIIPGTQHATAYWSQVSEQIVNFIKNT